MQQDFRVTVPEGEQGNASVVRFKLTKRDLRWANLHGGDRGNSEPGQYTKLFIDAGLVMSDTYDEYRDHIGIIHAAKGHVLIAGLGLGMVLQAIAKKENVTRITVIELNQNVIDLVGPHYKAMLGDKLEIICADILTWKPPKGIRYGAVWFDVWNEICLDNYDQIKKLIRRYAKRADWKGAWSYEDLKYQKRQETLGRRY